ALALAFIKFRTIGFDVALVFFGIHCAIVGYLILRSTFLPRIIGLLLAVGAIGYVANISAGFLPPALAREFFPYVMLPAGLAELSLTLWLMVVAVTASKWQPQAATKKG